MEKLLQRFVLEKLDRQRCISASILIKYSTVSKDDCLKTLILLLSKQWRLSEKIKPATQGNFQLMEDKA
jgi:hypothetical protein